APGSAARPGRMTAAWRSHEQGSHGHAQERESSLRSEQTTCPYDLELTCTAESSRRAHWQRPLCCWRSRHRPRPTPPVHRGSATPTTPTTATAATTSPTTTSG